MPGPRLLKPDASAKWLISLAAVFIFLFPAGAGAAELVVRCTDSGGAAVRLDRAVLLTYGWGYADGAGLRTEGNTATLPLDEAGLSALVGQSLEQIDGFFLYIEADGYAPVRSSSFLPPEQWAAGRAEPVVRFPSGETAELAEGKDAEVRVVLRRPVPKKLLLLDDDGRPVTGAEVISYMYWSSSNHCARLNGAWLLDKAVSGSDGMVEVPDGDFEYAFEIAANDMGLVLKEPELTEYPERLVTELKAGETVVRLHRRKSVALSMQVKKNGAPAAGETLLGCMADCPGGVCGSCCGPLATAGPEGNINKPVFYPEAYTSIFFETDDGDMLLEMDPAEMSFEAPLEVELGSCSELGGGR